MASLYESDVEQLAIELLENQGYLYLSPEAQEAERQDLSDVVLRVRLKSAIRAKTRFQAMKISTKC